MMRAWNRGNVDKLWTGLSMRTAVRRYATRTYMAPSAYVVSPREASESVNFRWPEEDGKQITSSIRTRHLRDFCPCAKCRHPDTNQRLLNTFSLPDDLHVNSLMPCAHGLQVKWSGSHGEDGHDSLYTWRWLKAKTLAQNHERDVKYWTSSIAYSPPVVDYECVMRSDDGVLRWIQNIRTYGFSYVEGCPVSPTATRELLERISFIRLSHYGGFWDFTSNLASKDMAYTTLELGAHTDTTYFSDPAGLQMFHLLEHSEGEGGKSLLVDGFRAAQVLLDDDADAVRYLNEVRITAHATGNDNAKIVTPRAFPVLDFRGDIASKVLDMIQVRWNNDDRGSFATNNPEEIANWYRAASRWDEIIQKPESQYWSQLEPGRPLIFDNWRVLHGRSAFTGKRRLCGAYLNMDDFLSRWRLLGLSKDELSNAL